MSKLTSSRAIICLSILHAGFGASAATFETVHEFNGKDGRNPKGGLAIDSRGNIYGTTSNGGGTLFRISPTGFETLHRFKGGVGDGSVPTGTLFVDEGDNVYGTTTAGGTTDAGTIFKFTPTGKYRLLVSLPGLGDAAQPIGGVVRDAASNTLFGATASGGSPGFSCGTIYKVDLATNQLSIIHYLAEIEGCSPFASLTLTDGILRGTTWSGGPNHGGGAPFSIKTTGKKFNAIVPTSGNINSYYAGLSSDGNGNFWGAAYQGGQSERGGIYKIDGSGIYTWVYEFPGYPAAQAPMGTPIIGADGGLYGTTQTGGPDNCGTIYKYNISTGDMVTLHEFRHQFDGCSPFAGLIESAPGVFYGVTYSWGANKVGTVFKITVP